MTRIAYVTGLRAEARIIETAAARAGRAAPNVACAGANGVRARTLAARLIDEGADLIVSFGVCGGLDPALPPGTLIVAEAIRYGVGSVIATDAAVRARLFEVLFYAGLRPVGGALLSSDAAVASAAEKARLHAGTRARAVDMESHGVAHAAHAAGVPMLALRAVADPAERDLPRAALVATGAEGEVNASAIAGALVRRPWEVPAMVRLGRDARQAFAMLDRAAGLLGGG